MRNIFYCVCMILSTMAFAETDLNYQVIILDPAVSTKDAQEYFPKARVYNIPEAAALRRKNFLPLHEQRDFFNKSQIGRYLNQRDQADKDVFVALLRESTPEQMHALYVDIPIEVCRNAIQLLKKY